MSAQTLPEWTRPYLTDGGYDASLMYTVVGAFDGLDRPMDPAKYRSHGEPGSVQLALLEKPDAPETFEAMLEGEFGRFLDEQLPAPLAAQIRAAPQAIELRGEVKQPQTLDYLRDLIGVITLLCDRGGAAVLDWATLTWYSPAQWREQLFEPSEALPLRHVTILLTPDDADPERLWIHSRGMAKFGRPDVGIWGVPPEAKPLAVELCKRFMHFMALGGVPADGTPVNARGIPEGMTLSWQGQPEDPDFNNRHLRLDWPRG